MRTSEQVDQLFAALSAVQGELEDVKKDRQGHGYRYADLGAVLDEVRPALARHGLCVTQLVGDLVDGLVTVETVLGHSSGQWLSTRASGPLHEGRMSPIQQVGSIITYLRRYSLAALVGLTQVDDDGSNQSSYSRTHEDAAAMAVCSKAATAQREIVKTENKAIVGALTRDTQARIWEAGVKLWGKAEAPAKIAALLGSLGLPQRSADLTEKQGRTLLDALLAEAAL
jgi:hypothetical protein